jgi:guanosine-3',5'-bis(diphosphate) 3'-pyrophosphohydrolase
VKWLQARQSAAFQDLPADVQQLLARLREQSPRADLDVVRAAYLFAEQAHRAQTRASGDPYITHAVAVASILVDLRLDPVTVAAGLLHDVAEDTGVTLRQVEEHFGAEIAGLVDGVTKLGRIEWMSREQRQAESLRKMFLAMASDIRIVLIKLADRLHNMRTLQYLPDWKQRRTAQETLDIYAPLAERLGIGRIQRELEDLAFAVLQPDAYQEIRRQLAEAESTRAQFLEQVADTLHRELNRAGVRVARDRITARPKHVYSIWKKMQRPKYAGQPVARIYDRLGVRVILDDVKDCYAALGVVHSLWKPIPGEFDDYIANPKTSGYQSLHTTVLYQGEPLEIQIRTLQMHREAEHGIAAHWKYKEGRPAEKEFEQKLAWLRQLLDWHAEVQDARAFVRSVKLDLFQNEVFVFTPKGDVIDLPAGATPVDFAYRIHTDVGHRCVGARVNGRLVPLSHRLRTGDIVEILTSKTEGRPSRDWLAFVVTTTARAKIRQWFKKEARDENIQRGREMLDKVAPRLGLASDEDLLAALGNGDVSLLQVVQALRPPEAPRPEAPAEPVPLPGRPPAPGGVRVRGADNVLTRLSRCCTPLPGDRIIGYVTRGRGVAIHRQDCPNVKALAAHPERFLEVEWESLPEGSYPVEIEVAAFDRVGLLKDILAAIADTKTNVVSVNARVRRDKIGVINVVLDIRNLAQLHTVMEKVGRVPEVYSVERVLHG